MKKSYLIWLVVIGYWLWFNVFTMVSNTEPLANLLYAQTLNSGLEKYRQGNLEEAIIDFETVISKEEGKPKTKELAKEYLLTCIIELGNQYKQAQDYQKALTYLEKGINLFPDNIEIKNLYQEIKEKPATIPQPPTVVPQPPVVVPQPPAVSPKTPAAVTQPPAVAPQPPAAVTQPPAVPSQAPVVSPQVPVEQKEVIPKKEKKKQPKEVITSKPVLTVTEVPLPTVRKTEIKRPSTLEITEERLKLMEEKVITLSQNYEQERKELIARLEEKNIMIKRIILYTFLIFIFFIFLLQYTIRKMFAKNIPKILTTPGKTVFLPDAQETEKIFSDWLNTLESKEIVQIVVVLLNSPEENVRAKGFEFLEKIMKTKKFTADEQWKIERTIRKIGLEEGWVGK